MNEERITLKDVYDAVYRVEDKLGKRLDDQDRKIQELKDFQNRALGILSAGTMLFSALISYFWDKVLRQ